jgi:PDZ domain-containing secreted protein
MKKSVLKIGLFSMVLLGIVSCKNKEKELADQRITELEIYVDSLKAANADELEANWDKIQMDFDRKNSEASDAITNLDNETKTSSQEKINSSTTKYDELKVSVTAKAEVKKAAAKPSASQLLRDRLFGSGKIGEDMSFAWVNKDNILKVYDAFFQSYKDNKGDFSREDYDEIKLMYEALDNRKNSVEKEGLTTEDNNKIASIKFKFGPMFKANRIGAKSRETAEAKE